MSPAEELVHDVTDATGLSEAAVRSVLWQVRRAGWHVVTFLGEDEDPPGGDWELIVTEWTP